MKEKLSTLIDEVRGEDISRRNLLRTGATASVLLAVGGMLSGCGGEDAMVTGSPSPSGLTDADILNFALNLEYLEAEFYTFATTGRSIQQEGIAIDGAGTAGGTTGGSQTNFTDQRIRDVALEIAKDERDHVTFLRSALGGARVAKPAINLAALGPFTTQSQFLALARAFEDVGTSAYGGAARLIQSKDILEAAARILAAEALHTGNIRLLTAINNVQSPAVDGKDIPPPPTGQKYFTLTTNGLSVIRTPREVLNIVYASTGTRGGFFPNGFNGTIRA
jgi:hypothetical protein